MQSRLVGRDVEGSIIKILFQYSPIEDWGIPREPSAMIAICRRWKKTTTWYSNTSKQDEFVTSFGSLVLGRQNIQHSLAQVSEVKSLLPYIRTQPSGIWFAQHEFDTIGGFTNRYSMNLAIILKKRESLYAVNKNNEMTDTGDPQAVNDEKLHCQMVWVWCTTAMRRINGPTFFTKQFIRKLCETDFVAFLISTDRWSEKITYRYAETENLIRHLASWHVNTTPFSRAWYHRRTIHEKKIKGKVVPVLNKSLCHEVVWGSGCIDPLFLDLGTSWWLGVSFTPQPVPVGYKVG
jgi:hypothetical protein